jgi:hypothetical protein
MHLPRKLVLVGAALGLIPIALGIVALVLDKWYYAVNGNSSLFGLFTNNNNMLCYGRITVQIIQGLEIGGVAAIGVGIITIVLLYMFIKNRWIRLLPLILLILGSTAILVGLILLTGCAGARDLGISMILMIIACAFGYIVSAYFALVAGIGWYHHHPQQHSSITVQRTVRF